VGGARWTIVSLDHRQWDGRPRFARFIVFGVGFVSHSHKSHLRYLMSVVDRIRRPRSARFLGPHRTHHSRCPFRGNEADGSRPLPETS
jgi:hypothetical protein